MGRWVSKLRHYIEQKHSKRRLYDLTSKGVIGSKQIHFEKDKISSWLTAQHHNSVEDAELDSGCIYQFKARNPQMICSKTFNGHVVRNKTVKRQEVNL
jgi:hypothetical protein